MAERFKLQAVLQLRRHQVTQAQVELGAAMREYQRTNDELLRTLAERKDVQTLLEDEQRQGMKAALIPIFHDYLKSLEQNVQRLKSELRNLTQRIHQAKAELLNRQTELKKIEILEEQAETVARQARMKQQQKRLDELALMARHSGQETSFDRKAENPS
jgi:flagellar export protein FliJ